MAPHMVRHESVHSDGRGGSRGSVQLQDWFRTIRIGSEQQAGVSFWGFTASMFGIGEGGGGVLCVLLRMAVLVSAISFNDGFGGLPHCGVGRGEFAVAVVITHLVLAVAEMREAPNTSPDAAWEKFLHGITLGAACFVVGVCKIELLTLLPIIDAAMFLRSMGGLGPGTSWGKAKRRKSIKFKLLSPRSSSSLEDDEAAEETAEATGFCVMLRFLRARGLPPAVGGTKKWTMCRSRLTGEGSISRPWCRTGLAPCEENPVWTDPTGNALVMPCTRLCEGLTAEVRMILRDAVGRDIGIGAWAGKVSSIMPSDTTSASTTWLPIAPAGEILVACSIIPVSDYAGLNSNHAASLIEGSMEELCVACDEFDMIGVELTTWGVMMRVVATEQQEGTSPPVQGLRRFVATNKDEASFCSVAVGECEEMLRLRVYRMRSVKGDRECIAVGCLAMPHGVEALDGSTRIALTPPTGLDSLASCATRGFVVISLSARSAFAHRRDMAGTHRPSPGSREPSIFEGSVCSEIVSNSASHSPEADKNNTPSRQKSVHQERTCNDGVEQWVQDSRSGPFGAPVTVQIVRHYKDPHDGHTVYVCSCQILGGGAWEIRRRFRDFQQLHERVRTSCESVKEPARLPRRHLFGNLSERVVAQRQHDLEEYLRRLIEILAPQGVGSCSVEEAPPWYALASFLQLPGSHVTGVE